MARCAELMVVTQGKTIKEAQENIKEAVSLYLEEYPKAEIRKLLPHRSPLIRTLEIASRG